jgi:hypothetical protein
VTETIIPLLRQAVPIIPFLSALLIAIPFAWISLRSRSLFLLRYRFWRLVQSKEAITDPVTLKAVQDRADLMSFRVLLMRADTPGEALRLATCGNPMNTSSLRTRRSREGAAPRAFQSKIRRNHRKP